LKSRVEGPLYIVASYSRQRRQERFKVELADIELRQPFGPGRRQKVQLDPTPVDRIAQVERAFQESGRLRRRVRKKERDAVEQPVRNRPVRLQTLSTAGPHSARDRHDLRGRRLGKAHYMGGPGLERVALLRSIAESVIDAGDAGQRPGHV